MPRVDCWTMFRLIVRQLALGIALVVSVAGCERSNRQNPAVAGADGLLRRGLSGEPATLDPGAAVDSFSTTVLRDLYEGLTSESATGEVVPGVASSWTVDATGTKYTFTIRPDARWSNGKPVVAQDFVEAWRRVVDPKFALPGADTLRIISGAPAIINGMAAATTLAATARNDSTLDVKLDQPATYFPQLLAHAAAYPIYSSESAKSHESASWISNGPYVLSHWSPGTDALLVKNPKYWDRENVQIAHVQYFFISDDSSQFARFRTNALDMTDNVPANAIQALRAQRSPELMIAPYLATAYYGLNLTAKPFASNQKLRQALAMAIDRKKIVEALGSGQTGAFGFVPPGTWNYANQAWDWKSMNDADRIAMAKQLYAAAGYSPKVPLKLRIVFNSNPGIRNTAVAVAAMWTDVLGVVSELNDEEYRVFLETRHDRSRWEVARLAWSADYNDAASFLETFRSGSVNNDEGYKNDKFDLLIEKAAHALDPGERRRKLEQSEAMMLSEYPVVPLYYFVSKLLVKSYVTGVNSNPLNHVPSKYIGFKSH